MNSKEIIIQCKQIYMRGNYDELICKDQIVYPPIPKHLNQILISQYMVALLDEYLHTTNFDKIDKKTKFPISMLYAIVANLLKFNKYQLAIKVIQNHFDKQNVENHHIISYNIAKFYAHLKQFKKSVFVLQNVLKQQPFFKQAVYQIAKIYINHLHRQEEGIKILQRHISNHHEQNQDLYAIYLHGCNLATPKQIYPFSQFKQVTLNLFNYFNLGVYFRLRNDQRAKQIFIDIIQLLQQKLKENNFLKMKKDIKLLILSKINLLLLLVNQKQYFNTDLPRFSIKSNINNSLKTTTKYLTISVKQLSEQIVQSYGGDLHQTTLLRLKKHIKQTQYPKKSLITGESIKGMQIKDVPNEKNSNFNQEYMILRDNNNKKLKYLLKKQKQLNAFFKNLEIKKGKNNQNFRFVVKISNQARERLIKNAKNDLNQQDYLFYQQEFQQIQQINNQSLEQIIQSIINKLPSKNIIKLNSNIQQSTFHKSQTKGSSSIAIKQINNLNKIGKILNQKDNNISKVKCLYKPSAGSNIKKLDSIQARKQIENKRDLQSQFINKKQNTDAVCKVINLSSSQKLSQQKKIQKNHSEEVAICNPPRSQKGLIKSQRSQKLFRIKIHQSINSIQSISSKNTRKKIVQTQKKLQNQTIYQKEFNNDQKPCEAKGKEQFNFDIANLKVNQNDSRICQTTKNKGESTKSIVANNDQLQCQQLSKKQLNILVSSQKKNNQINQQLQIPDKQQHGLPALIQQISKTQPPNTLKNILTKPKSNMLLCPNDSVMPRQDKTKENTGQKIQLECESKLSIVINSSNKNIQKFSETSQKQQHHQIYNKQDYQKKYNFKKQTINASSLQQFQQSLKNIELKVISSYKKESQKISSKLLVEQEIQQHKKQDDYDPLMSTFQLTNFDKKAFEFFLKNNKKSINESQIDQTIKQKGDKADFFNQEQVIENKQEDYLQIKQQLQKCKGLMKEGKIEQAFELYNFLYKNYKKSLEKQYILLGIGDLFIYQERYEEAQKTFTKCTKFNNAEAFLKLGLLQIKNNHIQLGVQNIQKANCIKRNNKEIENKLVYGYSLRQETIEKALALAQNILQKHPESLETLVMIAKILENQGKIKEAIDIVHAIDSFQPTEYIKHYLGVLYLIDSNLTQAFKNFKAALEIKPDYIPSLIEIATIISEISSKQSIDILTQVLEYDPGNRKALARLGKIYEVNQNDFENAMRTYRTALQHQPNYQSYMKVGDCLAKKQSYIEALLNYKEALNLKKTHEVYYKIGLMLSIKNQTLKAIEHFQLAIQLGERQGSIKSHQDIRQYLKYLGKLFLKVSSFDQAINTFEKILYQEESAQIYKLIGDANFGKKQYEIALQNYSKANSLSSSESIQILQNLAICFDKLQEYLASKEIYQKILQKQPSNIKCLNNLANVQLIIGQTNEAFYNYQNLLYYMPKNMQKRLKIADIYAEVGDWSKVEYHLIQCYKIKQNDERVLQRLINLYKQKRDYKLMGKYEKKKALIKHNLKPI